MSRLQAIENHEPTHTMSILTPADLATFTETPDGNLEVKIEKFGRLTVILPNGQTIEVYITRDASKQFGCFVTTDTVPDEKIKAKLEKLNEGCPCRVTHRLQVDGTLLPQAKADTRKARKESTGRAAASQPEAEAPEVTSGRFGVTEAQPATDPEIPAVAPQSPVEESPQI